MAGLDTAGRNAAVDGIAAVSTHVSLFDAAETEITGGSPAYARKAVTWTTASAGVRDNNAALTFDVPGGATVAFIGLHTALTAGTRNALYPAQGGTSALPHAATFAAATDVFTSYAHGFVNTNRVLLQDLRGAGLPTGFAENVLYFVVAATTDTFQLSATSGGAAITATTDAEVAAVLCVPETFGAQGTYTIATGALDIDANFL